MSGGLDFIYSLENHQSLVTKQAQDFQFSFLKQSYFKIVTSLIILIALFKSNRCWLVLFMTRTTCGGGWNSFFCIASQSLILESQHSGISTSLWCLWRSLLLSTRTLQFVRHKSNPAYLSDIGGFSFKSMELFCGGFPPQKAGKQGLFRLSLLFVQITFPKSHKEGRCFFGFFFRQGFTMQL